VGNDAQFGRLLDVLGLADGEGRFATNPLRLERRDELVPWLAAAIASRHRDELVAKLEAADVPAGPVNGVGEAARAMGEGWVTSVEGIRLAPAPILVDGGRPVIRRPPPRLGEHTASVLAELGRGR
jgi:crotonobetainyl-CoA:carnitine CoA-transferase CaiB-like acyl-CoA transferase